MKDTIGRSAPPNKRSVYTAYGTCRLLSEAEEAEKARFDRAEEARRHHRLRYTEAVLVNFRRIAGDCCNVLQSESAGCQELVRKDVVSEHMRKRHKGVSPLSQHQWFLEGCLGFNESIDRAASKPRLNEFMRIKGSLRIVLKKLRAIILYLEECLTQVLPYSIENVIYKLQPTVRFMSEHVERMLMLISDRKNKDAFAVSPAITFQLAERSLSLNESFVQLMPKYSERLAAAESSQPVSKPLIRPEFSEVVGIKVRGVIKLLVAYQCLFRTVSIFDFYLRKGKPEFLTEYPWFQKECSLYRLQSAKALKTLKGSYRKNIETSHKEIKSLHDSLTHFSERVRRHLRHLILSGDESVHTFTPGSRLLKGTIDACRQVPGPGSNEHECLYFAASTMIA